MNYIESTAETAFRKARGFYHVYSKPLEIDLLYRNDEELKIIINLITLSIMISRCRILAFAIMSNHIHFILEGPESACTEFVNSLLEKLGNYYRHNGRGRVTDSIQFSCAHIEDLRQLRTEIAYVIRNPFVVRTDVNLFACPMTSGHLYFNPFLKREGVPADSLKGRALRDFTRTRKDVELSSEIYVLDGVAQAWSFVDYERTMSFFDNARQFIMCAVKSVEAQIEVALRYNESVLLNDQELFSVAMKIARESFKCEKLSDLGRQELSLLALELKNRYRISNAQISRVCRIPRGDVDAMFPMASDNE